MNLISPPTRVLLTLSALKGVGPAALKKVAALPSFWELDWKDWSAAAPQVARALAESHSAALQEASRWADEQLRLAEVHSARILSGADAEYPALLAATKDDPFLLYVKGKLAGAPEKSAAVIGTREPTEHGVAIAERVTAFLAKHQWSVVSGLAIGCDAIAHRTAVDCGGHTVAVMAHGLQMVAPSRHKQLAQDILDSGGALVSEYPFGKDAIGSQFVKRDRTQAGMAQGVVMVQSDLKGGSLHASRAALDYERWLAVPFPTPLDRQNQEPKIQANLLIAQGPDAERAALLRCSAASLPLIQVIYSKDDYFKLVGTTAPAAKLTDTAAVVDAPWPPLSERASTWAPKHAEQPSELAGEQDVAQAPEVSRTDDAVDEARSSVAHYFLDLRPEDLSALHGFTSAIKKFAIRPHAYDVNLIPEVDSYLARAEHIANLLTALYETHKSNDFSLNSRCFHLQFQAEDLLVHMRRLAAHLHHDAEAPKVYVYGTRTLKTALTDQSVNTTAPLDEVLDKLVDGIPSSIKIQKDDSSALAEPEDAIAVRIDALLSSFNETIAGESFGPRID